MAGRPDDSPLLTALKKGRTLEEIRSIVEADPALLRRRSRDGDLPLHSAIRLCSPPEIVRYLLGQWPESIREPAGSLGRGLPVHLACKWEGEGRVRRGTDARARANVRLLIEAWPESIRERDGNGRLPLHLARSLSLIRYLIELWPLSIREPGRDGELMLHIAMEGDFPLPTIRFLVETWPESVRAKNADGRTALHDIHGGLSTESIRYLVEHDPDLLLVASNQGELPLHHYLNEYVNYGYDHNDIDQETVQYLIDRAPQSVRVKGKRGSLPLHVALQWSPARDEPEQPRLDCIQCLVSAWPQAVRETTNLGYLPLHVATMWTSEAELPFVPYLVEQWPESVRVKATDGSLAVHLVLQHEPICRFSLDKNQRILNTARFLLDQYPGSVHEATNEGLLPLHLVAKTGYGRSFGEEDGGGVDGEENDVEVEFLRYLVGLAPATVRAASNEFLFPFDYAIRNQCVSFPSIRFLAEQWPDVLGHSDSYGRTHLHAAATQDPPRLDVVQFVAELRPQLLETPDHGGSLPLHAAVAVLPVPHSDDLISYISNPESFGYQDRFQPYLEIVLQVIRYLAERRRQSLAEGDHRGSTPLLVAVARDVQSVDVVRLLVELRPESVWDVDANGALPLHVAVAHCQPTFSGRRNRRSHEVARPTPPLDLVRFLVEQGPLSVRRKDSKGWLPLYVAASNGADLDVLFFLATEWPQAIYGSRERNEAPLPSRPLKRRKLG